MALFTYFISSLFMNIIFKRTEVKPLFLSSFFSIFRGKIPDLAGERFRLPRVRIRDGQP